MNISVKQGFPVPKKDYYKVYVRSATYNQAPYIEDCLNGVAMQITNFPFIHHVIDDASTDGEQTVIREWMNRQCDMEQAEFYDNDICDIVCVKNKNNPNCTEMFYFLKENMWNNPRKDDMYTPWREACSYEALCEGDDFWIMPKKLQVQYDYLETNLDKTLVYTNCNVYFHAERILHESVFTSGYFRKTNSFKDFFLNNNYIAPCSWLWRIKEYAKIIYPQNVVDGTFCVATQLFAEDKIGYIDDVTVTYRIVHGSASHSNSIQNKYEYLKGIMNLYDYYFTKYKSQFSENEINSFYLKHYGDLAIYASLMDDKSTLGLILKYPGIKFTLKQWITITLSNVFFFRYILKKYLVFRIKKGL